MQCDYDFVFQFNRDVMRDVQIRAINASLLRNLNLTSPFSRIVARRVFPFRMKAHWGNPGLDYSDGLIKLSVDVLGGVRQPLKRINLTMETSVHADCEPRVAATGDDQPVVILTAPPTAALADLKLSYAADDKPLSWVDKAIGKRILRHGPLARLMTLLAGMPLSYLPDSWPLRVGAKRNDKNADGLMIAESAVALDPQAGLLTLAMRCTAETAVPPWSVNLLRPVANTAVALSETGLNKMLGWFCERDLATGTVQLVDGLASWRWMHVTASFTSNQNIRLTGELRCDETVIEVDITVECSVTSDVQLSVQLCGPAPQPPEPEADLVINASAALISRIFAAATRPPQPASPVRKNQILLRNCSSAFWSRGPAFRPSRRLLGWRCETGTSLRYTTYQWMMLAGGLPSRRNCQNLKSFSREFLMKRCRACPSSSSATSRWPTRTNHRTTTLGISIVETWSHVTDRLS